MTAGQENTEKHNSDRLKELLSRLSFDQLRFIAVRRKCNSDKQAAEELGIPVNTVYHWPDTVKDALQLMAMDGIIAAQQVIIDHCLEAALVKVKGLSSEDDKLRQAVATEVLDRVLGRALQPLDVTTKGKEIGSTDDDIAKAVAIIQGSGNSSASGETD